MTINSKQLFLTLDSAFEDAKQQIQNSCPGVRTVYITSWLGYSEKLHFKLEVQESYSKKAEVEGTDLQEMVTEAIHRFGFQKRQDTLQLAGPVIEGELEDDQLAPAQQPTVQGETADEIMF